MAGRQFIAAFIFLVAATGWNVKVNAQTVHAKVTDMRSAKGFVVVFIFKDQQSFKDSKPFKKLKYSKEKSASGMLNFSIALDPGTYGLSVIDDENSNVKMDYNMLGMPKEGFGFSDYYHSSLTRPVFSDFKFVLAADKGITIKMRYL